MADRTAHEVAVEAVAGAMRAEFDGSTMAGLVDAALAALATPEVRAAVWRELHQASVGDWPIYSPEGEATRWNADIVLDALAGTSGQETS